MNENTPSAFDVDQQFRWLGRDFNREFEAIRETHDELHIPASDLDSMERVLKGYQKPRNRVPEDELDRLQNVFQEVAEEGVNLGTIMDRLWDEVADTDWGPEFLYTLAHALTRPAREPIFHDSILIGAVARLEAHIARLFEAFFKAAPGALRDGEREAPKEFSISDLRGLNSLDDALALAIERRVRKIMYQGLEGWKKELKSRAALSLAHMGVDWAIVREIFLRRHCIVHHHSEATQEYSQLTGVDRDARVHADNEYVKPTLENLETLGAVLHIRMWAKFAVDKQILIESVEDLAFEALKKQRWNYCLAVYRAWLDLPLSETERLMAKVNIWIARKGSEGLDRIRQDVELWDAGRNGELYEFARACLLNNLDEAFVIAARLVERGELDGTALATWPLTAPLRSDPRIHQYNKIMREDIRDVSTSGDAL